MHLLVVSNELSQHTPRHLPYHLTSLKERGNAEKNRNVPTVVFCQTHMLYIRNPSLHVMMLLEAHATVYSSVSDEDLCGCNILPFHHNFHVATFCHPRYVGYPCSYTSQQIRQTEVRGKSQTFGITLVPYG